MKVSTSTEDRKAAAIYRDAAKGMEEHRLGIWSCWAICEAAKLPTYDSYSEDPPPIVRRYERVFKPSGSTGRWGMEWNSEKGNAHACRILALCFMAAIVEAGDA